MFRLRKSPPEDVWSNWSGDVACRPVRVARPTTARETAQVLADAAAEGLTVRPVGSGHSFTPLAECDGVLVDLTAMTGLDGVDADGRAWVRAGTGLAALNVLLRARGRAMPNLGDIDRQTISGAIATGTHGTGRRFTGLAAGVTGLEIATPAGGVVRCSRGERPDLFDAARVGLGAFGVVTAVQVATVPAFDLVAREQVQTLGEVFASLPHDIEAVDHVEFFWFPHTERALTKRNVRVAPGSSTVASPPPWRRWVDDELLSNGAFGLLTGAAARRPALAPAVNAVAAAALSDRTFSATSHEVFATPRRVRFRESEYAVPIEALRPVVEELRRGIDERGLRVTFPVEVRVADAADVWLSTAYRRPSAYVAVHQHVAADHRPLFELFEDIAAAHDGRPHWGKLHRLEASQLAGLYPRFADALAVRDEVDPERVLANPHLRRLLGD